VRAVRVCARWRTNRQLFRRRNNHSVSVQLTRNVILSEVAVRKADGNTSKDPYVPVRFQLQPTIHAGAHIDNDQSIT
jgi:hypothetical protein